MVWQAGAQVLYIVPDVLWVVLCWRLLMPIAQQDGLLRSALETLHNETEATMRTNCAG